MKFALVFAVSAAIGFFSDSFMGTGHDVAQNLISGNAAVRLLLTVLAVRAVLFIVSNNIGVTGGAFLPNLAFGALLGMLCAVLGQRLGAVDAGLTTLSVTLGMASFLGAVSKTPLMAIAFGIEALGGGSNVPAFVLATVTAYLVMEFSGVKEFADVAIEAKLSRACHTPSETGKFYTVTVADGSFADDRRYDDLLLPYGVRIISENETLHSGDTVTLCFTVEKKEGIVETLYGIFGSKAEIKKQ